ncbi:glycosyltransferase family 2 protein [Conyzicola sp.]|uniref:glycosyltransferase family 2 protein n=1 Tax=Conyzicola sp. TaxID=1969404 RepID=UPI003989752B
MRLMPARSTAKRAPLVTVVVPCYNYGHYLPACVESIVSQPGVDTDVLIIDDASTDNSAEVAAQLAESVPQVRFVHHTTNRGHIATYNEGLATVDSDYVVLLSADDMLAPGALGRATGLMEANPSVGLTYGNPQLFLDAPVHHRPRFTSWSVWQGDSWIDAQFKRGLSIIYSAEAVVRTSVHHTAGYYRPELPHSGDLEMWLRIASISDVGRVNGADQAYRREHAASMMHTYYASAVEDLRRRDGAYESFLATAGANLPGRDRLRTTVRRGMSRETIEWALHNRGAADPAEIDDAVAFAKELNPDYASLRVWREFERMNRPPGTPVGPAGRLGGWYDANLRGISNSYHWRRWRYFGV